MVIINSKNPVNEQLLRDKGNENPDNKGELNINVSDWKWEWETSI